MAKYGPPVTNPSLLAELEGSPQAASSPKYGPPVTDPALLEQLESGDEPSRSFYDLSKEDQKKAMDLARQQISKQYPNMPDWLRDMMLTITPKDKNPRLQQMANEAQADTNGIPVVAGGLMQGFATPFQGIASMIPGKTAENFSNQDFTDYLPKPQNDTERAMQTAAELIGGFGPVGKLFGMLKGGTQLAKVPKALQNATALAGTGAIATPGDVVNKALGAAGALTLGGAGKVASQAGRAVATKIPAFLRGLTNESTPQSIAEAVQKPHDILSNTAEQLYDYVRGAIKKRNLSIPVKPEYISKAEEVLPKTRASKKLIDDARSGDYDAVHDLQSQLYKKGTAGIASDDIAMQNQGDEILDLRNQINDDVKSNLMQTGHVDIAHVLDQGKSVYKKLMGTYFNKNLPKAIGKMVQSDLRLVPDNPEKIFQQDSVPMKRFLKGHPEVAKHVQGVSEKQAAKKALSKIFTNTAKVGGVGFVGKNLFDLFK
jgi:hypothetical protein